MPSLLPAPCTSYLVLPSLTFILSHLLHPPKAVQKPLLCPFIGFTSFLSASQSPLLMFPKQHLKILMSQELPDFNKLWEQKSYLTYSSLPSVWQETQSSLPECCQGSSGLPTWFSVSVLGFPWLPFLKQTPGSPLQCVFTWSLSHAQRAGDNSAAVYVGAPQHRDWVPCASQLQNVSPAVLSMHPRKVSTPQSIPDGDTDVQSAHTRIWPFPQIE